MLFSVEQAFVGRDEKRTPLKTPAWEATSKYAQAILSSVSSKIVSTHSGPVTKVLFYVLSIGLLFGAVASLGS